MISVLARALAAIVGAVLGLGVIAIGGCFIVLLAYAERCDTKITQEAAVRIAREYFLARSISEFEKGEAWERKQAAYMIRAGLTEPTYGRLFSADKAGRPRKVGDQWCGQPLVYYHATDSLAYGGFNIDFTLATVTSNPTKISFITAGVNVTECGNIGIHFTAHDHSAGEKLAANFQPCPQAE